jgi:hypothetical protein
MKYTGVSFEGDVQLCVNHRESKKENESERENSYYADVYVW